MPTITIGDIAELTIHATLNGQQIVNRFHIGARNHFSIASEGQDELQAMADALKELLRARQCNDLVYSTWEARQVRGAGVTYNAQGDQVGGWVAEGNHTGTLLGANATGEPLPPQVAALISWRSGFAGRSKRARTYVAGMGTDETSDGVIDAATRTTWQTAVNTFLGLYGLNGTDVNFALGVWSHRIATGKKLVYNVNTGAGTLTPTDTPAPNNAWVEISSGMVQSPLATQRRRRVGVGI